MSSTENSMLEEEDNSSGIDFRSLFFKALAIWHWIFLSILLCLLVAFLYLRYSTPVYQITARVLVNDETKGGGLGASSALGDLGGLLGSKSTVDNEAEIFKTKFLMREVIEDMNLNVVYYSSGRVKDIELYSPPFILEQLHLKDHFDPAVYSISEIEGGKLRLVGNALDTLVNFNSTFILPNIGQVRFKRNTRIPLDETEYKFSIVSVKTCATDLLKNLDVVVPNKLVTIIDLSLKHAIPKKGEDILNRLIYNYVQGNIRDKSEIADSTIKFIKQRLESIGAELQGIESSIQVFKQDNNLTDMSEQGKLLVASTSEYVNELAKVETKITILKSLQSYLQDSENLRVLPSALIEGDLVFSALIERYNTLLVERDRRLLSTTVKNPVVINLEEQITNVRNDILSNIQSTLSSMVITRNRVASQVKNASSQIKDVPRTERSFLNLARQQQIKQELFIFLMQKSEESAISKTSNISNSRTIDPPESDVKPISPKKSVVYLLGFLIGGVIPLSLLYAKESFNTKIQSRDDITSATKVPIIGEISHNVNGDNLIVSNDSRSVIAEQLRALRTNLPFYLKNKEDKIVLLTSSNSGEGKSFLSLNLGNILAISGKKVVIMEMDLRKPGLSSKLGVKNTFGITNYLIDSSVSIEAITTSSKLNDNLFVISSGPIPPNPAELLLNEKLDILMSELRVKFDYIVIDAPPIGIIADAQLLAKYADICLYVLRQKFTLKTQLRIVQDLYSKRKMKQVAVVVNDIDVSSASGYGNGYGGYGNQVYGLYEANALDERPGFFNGFFKRNKR